MSIEYKIKKCIHFTEFISIWHISSIILTYIFIKYRHESFEYFDINTVWYDNCFIAWILGFSFMFKETVMLLIDFIHIKGKSCVSLRIMYSLWISVARRYYILIQFFLFTYVELVLEVIHFYFCALSHISVKIPSRISFFSFSRASFFL